MLFSDWIAGAEPAGGHGAGDGPVVVEGPDHAVSLLRPAGSDGPWVVAGPRTTARYHPRRAGPVCARLRLRPGRAAMLLGRPLSGLVDREIRLDGPLSVPVDPAGPSADPVEAAAALLAEGVPVHAVARRLHLSERHLRTLFIRGTGLTPTAFVRIDRVRAVLGGAGHPGYYDQSHLIAEFRRVMGVPPGAYAKGRRPATTACPAPPG